MPNGGEIGAGCDSVCKCESWYHSHCIRMNNFYLQKTNLALRTRPADTSHFEWAAYLGGSADPWHNIPDCLDYGRDYNGAIHGN